MCDSSSESWFQDGEKTEELHEIQAKVDEIVADELVCPLCKPLKKNT
jgi:rubredoxin